MGKSSPDPTAGFPRRAAGALVRRAGRLAERVLEARYGVRTAEFVYLEDLGLEPEHRVWHDPSDWLGLRRALGRLGVGPDDVFVDYGSGLGRAVLVAASMPFRRVIGVELSEEMTARARENVRRNRHRLKAQEVELVSADAIEWEVPPDLMVAYLYCPFTEDVFDGVMQKLFDSVDEHPRPLRIVYNYPLEHSRLIRSGRVRVLDVIGSRWLTRSRVGSDVIVTYLVLPQDEALRREYVDRFPQRLGGAEVWLGEHEPGYSLEKPERLGGVVVRRPARSSRGPSSGGKKATL
jgi:SAM-dependent methyltransferase